MGTSTAAAPVLSHAVHLSPTSQSERIDVIDVLRGIAIFGILMVNMHYFANPWLAPHLTADSSVLDRVVSWIVEVFFTSKFYTMFSFLFGLGLTLQMSRAQQAGIRFVPLYARRLAILLVFGLAHAVLLWTGDILVVYALLGFLLLVFWRNAKPKTLLIWAGILFAISLLIFAFGAAMMMLASATPEGSEMMEQIAADNAVVMEAALAQDMLIYDRGSYMEVTAERLQDFRVMLFEQNIWIAPSILAMFLLGMYAGKRRLFQEIEANLSFFRKLLMVLLPIGLITNIAWASMGYDIAAANVLMKPGILGGMILLGIGGPALSLSYVCLVVLATRQARMARLLAPFASVGRMALSNYLTHSLIMTTLFYGYGFGLLGMVGTAAENLIGLALYALQIPLSVWWMSQFRFGPFEWVWRSLTYGEIQPIRIRQIA